MRAAEFIQIAEEFVSAASPKRAAFRSAVSRAYYGAHLIVRDELIRPMGFKLRSGGNEHLWVQRVLGNCGVPEAIDLARYLKNLQKLRTQADYDLHLQECESRGVAIACLGRAQNVAKLVETFSGTELFAQIQSGITTYLKKINEL
jgi:uncharacterized protein (UPF0332 family)